MHDLICFSHLRWGFVWQRPQHLMTRFAREGRVFFVEEPVPIDGGAHLDVVPDARGVTVLVPRIPADTADKNAVVERLLRVFFRAERVTDPVLWYYTPMALEFSRGIDASVVVYDCMDELTGFAGAPPALRKLEPELMRRADVMFTGGVSLFEAKRGLHPNVHAFPSAVDVEHFRRARHLHHEPTDQAGIPHPRIGFYGVIDERLDVDLLTGMAERRPQWQFVMLGPVVKIDAKVLPRHLNIHYLGAKSYGALPDYVGGWNVAMLPFARNDATRFISPTKTPEYLAAGLPVVSTSIADVVRPYQGLGLARIADTPEAFGLAIHHAMTEPRAGRLEAADRYLAKVSWDETWQQMRDHVDAARRPRVVAKRHRPATTSAGAFGARHLPLHPRWANPS